MDFERERRNMVARLRAMGYISDPRVMRAMEKVPRHLFVPPEQVRNAYIDSPLPIGEGQTISAPHMVAIMVEAADLRPGMKILEVGGGSGYNAAVMAELVRPDGKVYTVERVPSLAARARENLQRAGYGDIVEVIVGDGSKGLEKYQPFDRIVVTAASPGIPEPLKDQLADGGMILIPVGTRYHQELYRITRKGDRFITENLGGCIFVPLIGEYGFEE